MKYPLSLKNCRLPTPFMAVLLNITYYTQQITIQESDLQAVNHSIWADVPLTSVIRSRDTFYMSCNRMNMSLHFPIMISNDPATRETVSCDLETVEYADFMCINNVRNDYGREPWAGILRFNQGNCCVSAFSHTTGKTDVIAKKDIGNGSWKTISLSDCSHDNTFLFDDDTSVYIIYGVDCLKLAGITVDAPGVKPGDAETVIIEMQVLRRMIKFNCS